MPEHFSPSEDGLAGFKTPDGYHREKIYHLRSRNDNNTQGKELRITVPNSIFLAVEETKERYKGEYRYISDVVKNWMLHGMVYENEKDASKVLSIAIAHYKAENRAQELEWLEKNYEIQKEMIRKSVGVESRIEAVKQELLDLAGHLPDEYSDWRTKYFELARDL